MKRLVFLLTLLLGLLLGSSSPRAEPLGVGVVLDLLGAGISEESIQSYVERNQFQFDPTAADLEALEDAGASENLILFLQDRTRNASASGTRTRLETQGGEEETTTTGSEEYDGDYLIGYGSPEYIPTYSYGVYFSYPYFFGGPYYYGPYYYPSYGYYYGPGYYSGRVYRGAGVHSHRHHRRPSQSGGRVRSHSPRSRSEGTVTRSSGRSGRRGRR